MEDDTEILDWGNEEEERNTVGGVQRSFAPEEDAVSLGGDEEDDEFLAHQSRVPQSTNRGQTPSKPMEPSAKGMATDARQRRVAEPVRPDTPPKHSDKAPQQPSTLPLSLPLGKLTHALPAKPVSSMSFVHPSHPAVIAATAMASHSDRNKRNSGAPSIRSHDNGDSLPSGWEIKWSQSTGEVYYYNTRTEESTWTRPGSPSPRETHSYRPEDSLDRGFSSRNGDIPLRKGRSDGDDLSYDDRHYRPTENGRRDDRPTQTYSGDSYQISNRQNGPSSLPSRTRDDQKGPSSRRPHSPSGRDSVQSARREAPATTTLSAQDRSWVASDVIRERERRQHDSGGSSDHDRRPRDTDKSSTLRPRSPVIYTREPEAPEASSKSIQSVSSSSTSRQKSRFSQSAPSQSDQRQSNNQDGISQQLHDNAPVSYRTPINNVPAKGPPTGPRSLPSTQGDSTVPPVIEAQRSRKRTPLPPQSTTYREGSKVSDLDTGTRPEVQGSSLRGRDSKVAYLDSDIPTSNHNGSQHTSMRSSSLLPSTTDGTTDRTEHDRHLRRGKSTQITDSYVANESFVAKGHCPDSMDIDDVPPRPLDSQRHFSRRPPTREERGTTLNLSPVESSRLRVPSFPERPRTESSGRVHDDLPFPNSARDKPSEDRYAPTDSLQRDRTRSQDDTRTPPAAPSIRLSGTNNIPIGTRNKPLGNAPPPQSNRSRVAVISGSNAEPIGSHPRVAVREASLLSSDVDGHRDAELTRLRRRSPLSSNHPLPSTGAPVTTPAAPQSLRVARSRFGPPVIKDVMERPRREPSPESPRSAFYAPGDGSRATPPPPSRESSMPSVVHHDRSPHDHPPRHPSRSDGLHPHKSSRHSERGYSPSTFPRSLSRAQAHEVESFSTEKRDVPSHSSIQRRRTMDAHIPVSTKELRDTEGGYHMVPPVIQDTNSPDDHTETKPHMHPERAMLLQHGLPPRPQVDFPPPHPGRASRRDRPEKGGRRLPSPSLSPERPHPVVNYTSPGRGGSLLDRLAPDGGEKMPTFRDRVQVPTKRDREEMWGDSPMEQDYDGPDGQKRVRKRSTKLRRSKPGP